MTGSRAETDRPISSRFGRPPIPHEHGAWVILFAPMLLGFGATGHFAPLRWALLTLTIGGAFLAREAAGLLLRKRGKTGISFWLGLYGGAFCLGGLPLLWLSNPAPLLAIGLLSALLFGIHSTLMLSRRQDRSLWGELLGVSALTLTAPAAYATTRGALDSTSALLWIACIGYFGSGVFYVKMWLSAAKAKATWNAATRRRLGRDNLLYHLALTLLLGIAGWIVPNRAGTLVVLAYLPALIRGYAGSAALSPTLPPLKRVGMLEALRAIWFTLLMISALRFLLL